MRKRANQKIRRRSHREAGIFLKNNILRVVVLHPTKGFRDTNGEYGRGAMEVARNNGEGIKIKRGNRLISMQPVRNNAPSVRHNKAG